ncbi:elongation factor P [Candidatus Curtissbacteria bacterium RIFCSPHIGHO2_01_FULL_41_11]|uniref:Elongation factor P n=1 Tax=Candidatus Curtissbacteria bacterium RIFCSPHIGHO2_01_FULL_41_11 TaxID=1797711 RepID=A0A1F5G5N7_9BACT|nr:MAG: elongation factor P [Candidatus Curtissbacteria bacterium RIFCSPHIGHO2_01_FULL_41_11]
MISVTELRAGVVFEEKGDYFLVLSYEHIKMGRGGGTIKVKVRNLSNGAIVEKSFPNGNRVQEASIERKGVQYLYRDGEEFHFMDNESYEQFVLAESLVGDNAPYLKEGLELLLFAIGDKPLYIELSKILDYKVTQTGGSARGNTVGAAQKDALLENGLRVKVPLFIKNGEVIRVDTRTGSYVARAK